MIKIREWKQQTQSLRVYIGEEFSTILLSQVDTAQKNVRLYVLIEHGRERVDWVFALSQFYCRLN